MCSVCVRCVSLREADTALTCAHTSSCFGGTVPGPRSRTNTSRMSAGPSGAAAPASFVCGSETRGARQSPDAARCQHQDQPRAARGLCSGLRFQLTGSKRKRVRLGTSGTGRPARDQRTGAQQTEIGALHGDARHHKFEPSLGLP